MWGVLSYMKSGIYTIENLVNGKLYIGLAKTLKSRKLGHWSQLKRNVHNNSHLQRAVNEYGIENFKFEVLIECEEQYLKSEEHYLGNYIECT